MFDKIIETFLLGIVLFGLTFTFINIVKNGPKAVEGIIKTVNLK